MNILLIFLQITIMGIDYDSSRIVEYTMTGDSGGYLSFDTIRIVNIPIIKTNPVGGEQTETLYIKILMAGIDLIAVIILSLILFIYFGLKFSKNINRGYKTAWRYWFINLFRKQ